MMMHVAVLDILSNRRIEADRVASVASRPWFRPLMRDVGCLSSEPGIVRRMRRSSPTESPSECRRRIRLRFVAAGTDLAARSVRVTSRLRSRIA